MVELGAVSHCRTQSRDYRVFSKYNLLRERTPPHICVVAGEKDPV
jgi:hypothetical protein